MKNLQKCFFLELDNTKLDWIKNPFVVPNRSIDHLSPSKKEFVTLSSDLKVKLSKKKLSIFWLRQAEYSALSDLAITVFLPSTSNRQYLCKHYI